VAPCGMLFNEMYILSDGGTFWGRPVGSDPKTPHSFAFMECFDYPYYGTLDVRFYGSMPLLKFWPDLEKNVMREFAATLQAKAPEIKGIAFFAEETGNEPARTQPKYTVGDVTLAYQVGEKSFRVSAGSFFQVNRYMLRDLVQTVVGDFHGRIALDLYAGVGLFATHLAKRFDQVFARHSYDFRLSPFTFACPNEGVGAPPRGACPEGEV